jgi:hypothetical protein
MVKFVFELECEELQKSDMDFLSHDIQLVISKALQQLNIKSFTFKGGLVYQK